MLLAFARKISLFSVGLCADRYILVSGPRHGASYQSRDTRNHESCCVAAAAATPTIKLAVEMMPSVGPEHRCSQPPDATDEVVLRVQAQTTHPTSCPSKVTAFP